MWRLLLRAFLSECWWQGKNALLFKVFCYNLQTCNMMYFLCLELLPKNCRKTCCNKNRNENWEMSGFSQEASLESLCGWYSSSMTWFALQRAPPSLYFQLYFFLNYKKKHLPLPRFELTTFRVTTRCSTTELLWLMIFGLLFYCTSRWFGGTPKWGNTKIKRPLLVNQVTDELYLTVTSFFAKNKKWDKPSTVILPWWKEATQTI